MFNSLAVVGDITGIPKLLQHIPPNKITVLIAASIRPQYINELTSVAQRISKPLLIQPKYKSPEYNNFVQYLKSHKIDMLVCCSYSMLIRPDVLEIVKYNAINIHSSLLPKNRGPNPTQWSIIKGEKNTGVTMHYMDCGLDTGNIICQEKVSIEDDDSWVSVSKKLDLATNKIIEKSTPNILSGNHNSTPQNNKDATINFRLNKEYPRIEFSKMNILDIYNLIRAQIPPLGGAYYIDKKLGRVTIDTMITKDQVALLKKKQLPPE
jgi:methionyl-tRNA formyltransferase